MVGVESLNEQGSACVEVAEDVSSCFRVYDGPRNWCGIPLQFFNNSRTGVGREVYNKAQERGVRIID